MCHPLTQATVGGQATGQVGIIVLQLMDSEVVGF